MNRTMSQTSRSVGVPQDASVLRYLLRFVFIALLAYAVEIVPWIDEHAVQNVLAGIAWLGGHLVAWFGGCATVDGVEIRSCRGFAIAIANGCSGLEAVILLGAAILAFPASWRARAIGVTLGSAAIMALNIVRVISLLYIGQYSHAWFDWAHLYLWDVLIMLDALLVFLIWVRRLPAGVARAATA